MPKMHVHKSITIDAPVEKVYKTVSDFNKWTQWSPWLIMEPEATVTVSADSKSYEWEGKRTGSGNMRITDSKENEWVNYDLNFLKPWKSHALVRFELKSNGDSTEAHWYMDSGLPFFLFWMKKMMTAYVGMDYERGLDMLKAYVENGKVPSSLEWKGISQFDGYNYVGIKTICPISKVGEQMSADFAKLHSYIEAHPDLPSAEPFSIYHKWDVVKDKVSYTSGFPVKEVPADLPAGFISGNIPATKIYTLRHTGRYQHLGNAWSTLMTMHRNKEFKPVKGIHPFEVYRNEPGKVAEEELITDVNFAVKA